MVARHQDPGGKVADEADTGGERQREEDHSDERHVLADVSGDPGADTGELFIALVEHERAGLVGGVSDAGASAAAGAKAIVVAELNAALGAEHGWSPIDPKNARRIGAWQAESLRYIWGTEDW